LGQVYGDATVEARRRGDRRVGTDHLALALLNDPTTDAAQALGVSLDAARTALRTLDIEALARLGIDASTVESDVEPSGTERLRLTPSARTVFTRLRTVAEGNRLGREHVLLVLLDQQEPEPAAALFDALGIDRDAVRERLDLRREAIDGSTGE
jgi:ATP-dependent Clp protease ATP-binding subunit ClpA